MSILPKEMVVDEIQICLGVLIRQPCMWGGQNVFELV